MTSAGDFGNLAHQIFVLITMLEPYRSHEGRCEVERLVLSTSLWEQKTKVKLFLYFQVEEPRVAPARFDVYCKLE